MRIFILGGSGRVGRLVIEQGLGRGHRFTATTRDVAAFPVSDGRVDVVAVRPTDQAALTAALPGHDAVVMAIGTDRMGATTLFSDATRALIPAMDGAGIARLVAVTGIGAGDTRGHGGFVYDRIIYPLFTRHRYADKTVQEGLIAASGLDWTIVRPAPFKATAPDAPLTIVTDIRRDTVLRRITCSEVAGFVLDAIERRAFVREKPFIGHVR